MHALPGRQGGGLERRNTTAVWQAHRHVRHVDRGHRPSRTSGWRADGRQWRVGQREREHRRRLREAGVARAGCMEDVGRARGVMQILRGEEHAGQARRFEACRRLEQHILCDQLALDDCPLPRRRRCAQGRHALDGPLGIEEHPCNKLLRETGQRERRGRAARAALGVHVHVDDLLDDLLDHDRLRLRHGVCLHGQVHGVGLLPPAPLRLGRGQRVGELGLVACAQLLFGARAVLLHGRHADARALQQQLDLLVGRVDLLLQPLALVLKTGGDEAHLASVEESEVHHLLHRERRLIEVLAVYVQQLEKLRDDICFRGGRLRVFDRATDLAAPARRNGPRGRAGRQLNGQWRQVQRAGRDGCGEEVQFQGIRADNSSAAGRIFAEIGEDARSAKGYRHLGVHGRRQGVVAVRQRAVGALLGRVVGAAQQRLDRHGALCKWGAGQASLQGDGDEIVRFVIVQDHLLLKHESVAVPCQARRHHRVGRVLGRRERAAHDRKHAHEVPRYKALESINVL
eukprot:m.103823 g.103823  ORF g.103823 m.103823 type:complete len:514 (-) comp8867_c0_seq2:931-2472(-)